MGGGILAVLRSVRRRLVLLGGGLRHALERRRGKQIVHVLHIGKTGGTAVGEALRRHLRTDRCVIALHPHWVRLRDIPAGDRVVFFVRDPIARFVSGFYGRQRQDRPRYYYPWTPDEREAFEHFGTPGALARGLSSGDPAEQARARKAMRSIGHVRDSYWDWFESEAYFLSRLPDILFVGAQESLAEDLEELKLLLGLPPEIRLPDDSVRAHRNPKHLSYDLDQVAVRNLQAWYEREWAFLRLCRERVPGCAAIRGAEGCDAP